MSQTKVAYRQQVKKWEAAQKQSISIDERSIADLKAEIKSKQKLLKLEQENVRLKKRVMQVYMRDVANYLKK